MNYKWREYTRTDIYHVMTFLKLSNNKWQSKFPVRVSLFAKQIISRVYATQKLKFQKYPTRGGQGKSLHIKITSKYMFHITNVVSSGWYYPLCSVILSNLIYYYPM